MYLTDPLLGYPPGTCRPRERAGGQPQAYYVFKIRIVRCLNSRERGETRVLPTCWATGQFWSYLRTDARQTRNTKRAGKVQT